uniref:Flavoprotein domain-containing protein n=1 Tax=Calidris pygmaea TaxID=425635 RepID=A0A8C3J1T3_9CHAR
MEPFSAPEPGFPAEKSSSATPKTFRVLVGVTGSVAALKLPLLIAELLKIPGLEVKVVTTERAKHFYNAQEIPVTLYSDEDEWRVSCSSFGDCKGFCPVPTSHTSCNSSRSLTHSCLLLPEGQRVTLHEKASRNLPASLGDSLSCSSAEQQVKVFL